MQSCRIGISPGGHGQIKLNDDTRVEELVRSHEGIHRVPLHKPHGVSKLGKGCESCKVVKMLFVQILATTIIIARNGAIVEDRPFDNGARRLILRNVENWTLCR